MPPPANPNTISIEPSAAGAASSSSKRPGKRARTAPSLAVTVGEDGDEGDQAGGKKQKKFRHRVPKEEREAKPDKEVGVSKLKANLRQAKRFLAKEGLDADVKTETERRIKSIQADIERASARNDEKKNAEKYHMVKFFERKKLLRRLQPRLKTLSSTPPTEAKALAALNQEIMNLRIGLNYVLNYPNSRKYISLFPPSSKPAVEGDAEGEEEDDGKGMPVVRPSKANADDTDKARSELVQEVKKLMADGTLPAEPEKTLGADGAAPANASRISLLDPSKAASSSSKKAASGQDKTALAKDDFFGGDDSDSD